jgi:hypothetical protein
LSKLFSERGCRNIEPLGICSDSQDLDLESVTVRFRRDRGQLEVTIKDENLGRSSCLVPIGEVGQITADIIHTDPQDLSFQRIFVVRTA